MSQIHTSEAGWVAGREATIKRNARVGNKRRGVAEYGEETTKQIADFLGHVNEFAPVLYVLENGQRRDITVEESNSGQWGHEEIGLDTHPVVKAVWGDFLRSMLDQYREWGKLSEKQTAAVLKAIARGEEKVDQHSEKVKEWEKEAEAADPVPTGKITVSGTILSTKMQDTRYGTTQKMLLKSDQGYKLWGSVPKTLNDIQWEGNNGFGAKKLVGMRVSFNATVEPSPKDDKFGFFKRPTKVNVL